MVFSLLRGSIGPTLGAPNTAGAASFAVAIKPNVVRLAVSREYPVNTGVTVEFEKSVAGGSYESVLARSQTAPQVYDLTPTPGSSTTYRYKSTSASTWTTQTISVPSTDNTPLSVSGVTISEITSNSCFVRWANQSSSNEDGFVVAASVDSGATWRVLARPFVGSVSCWINGLQSSANTIIGVATYNTSGQSAYASSAQFTTPVPSGAAPAAPSALSVKAAEATRLHIQFYLPDETSDSVSVEISSNNGATWSEYCVLGKSIWSAWITGLLQLTEYSVRVRSLNGGGYSSYSAVVKATTLATGSVLSPTGTNPAILWNPHLHELWLQRKANYDANPASPSALGGRWWKQLLTFTGLDPIADAILYIATGTTSYATAAYTKAFDAMYGANPIEYKNLFNKNRDSYREYSSEFLIALDWVYPALTAPQQANCRIAFKHFWLAATDFNDSIATYTSDSDQASLNFFALAIVASALKNKDVGLSFATNDGSWASDQYNLYNTPAGSSVGDPIKNTYNYYFGGLSISDYASSKSKYLANTVLNEYSFVADEGAWFEGGQYNTGTPTLVMVAMEAVRSARSYYGDNTDYFKKLRLGFIKMTDRWAYAYTPDYKQRIRWGDESQTSAFGSFPLILGNATKCVTVTAGISGNISNYSAVAARLIADIDSQPDPSSYARLECPRRFLMYFDTSTSPAAKSSFVKYKTYKKAGEVAHQDGWGPNDSFFWFQSAESPHVDHSPINNNDLQLYRKGVFVVTHAQGYLGNQASAYGSNGVGFAGLGGFVGDTVLPSGADPVYPYGARGVVKSQHSDAATYAYSQSYGPTSYGSFDKVYDPPTQFVFESSREVVYLPSTSKTSDVIVTFDRALLFNIRRAVNSASNIKFSFFGDSQAANSASKISAAKGLFEWYLHCPVNPDVSIADKTSWAVPSSTQSVKVEHLFPTTRQRFVTDQSVDWAASTSTLAAEKKYHITLTNAAPNDWPANDGANWRTFLNVISAYDSGVTVSSSLVQSSSGASVTGALITRSSENDVVVLFCSTPATMTLSPVPYDTAYGYTAQQQISNNTVRNRDVASGFTVSFTQGSASAKIFAHDLSVAGTWSVSINGATAVPVSVSSNGVAEISTATAGVKTLIFTVV
jgi:hypothetical protein